MVKMQAQWRENSESNKLYFRLNSSKLFDKTRLWWLWQQRMLQNLIECDPSLRIFCQHPGNKIFGFVRNGLGPNKVPVLDVPLCDFRRLRVERRLPEQHFVDNDSDWPDVRFGIALALSDHFCKETYDSVCAILWFKWKSKFFMFTSPW